MKDARSDSFVFYRSYYESIMKLDKDTDKVELFKCIGKYALDGELYESPVDYINSIFEASRVNIDYSLERRKKSIENGSKGGAPKGNRNASKQPRTTENNLNDNGNVYGDADVNEDDKADENTNGNLNANENSYEDEIPKRRAIGVASIRSLTVSDLSSYFPDEDINRLDRYYSELKKNAFRSKATRREVNTIDEMKKDIERNKENGFYE